MERGQPKSPLKQQRRSRGQQLQQAAAAAAAAAPGVDIDDMESFPSIGAPRFGKPIFGLTQREHMLAQRPGVSVGEKQHAAAMSLPLPQPSWHGEWLI